MQRFLSAAVVCLGAASLLIAEGRVRVVHASPDAPKVDIRVDGQPALDAIPFGASTGYVPVPDGAHKFGIYVTGTDTLVTEVDAVIAPNSRYTVAAIGFAEANKTPGFRVIVLPDDRDDPNDGVAYIRFVHASPSAPPVDIYVGGSPYETVRGRNPLLSAFPFGIATGYLGVPAGTYYARLTPAGEKTPIALESGAVMLPSRGVHTAFALDGGVLLLTD
jgi:hypothetical protein